MFTVITGYHGKKPGLFKKKISLEMVQDAGIGFSVLRLKRPEKTNWKKLRAILGQSSGRAVFERGLEPPADEWIQPFGSLRYSRELMKMGLFELLRRCQTELADQTAVLVDLNCRYQSIADILVRYYGSLRVITRDCEVYRNYIDSKLYECGAAVIVTPLSAPVQQVSLFVSPDGVILRQMQEGNAPIVVSEPSLSTDAVLPRLVSSFRANTPPPYDRLLPAGIDDHLFQAALFECCGIRALGKRIPDSFLVGGRIKVLDDGKISIRSF